MTKIEERLQGELLEALREAYYKVIVEELKDDFPAEYKKHRNDYGEEQINKAMENIKIMGRIICNGWWAGIKKNSPFYPLKLEETAFKAALNSIEGRVNLGLKEAITPLWWAFEYEKDGKKVRKEVGDVVRVW